jgi:hypothetical protein
MTTAHSITEDIFFGLDMRMILRQVERSSDTLGLSVVGQTEQVACLGADKTFNLSTPKLRVEAKETLCGRLLIVGQRQHCARLLDTGNPDKS